MLRLPGPVAALLVCLFLAVLLRTAWIGDDALITLRSVLNVTHGYGLTFNILERVQTFTHPLWLLLLTGAYLLVGNVYSATFGLSIGVSLLTFWMAIRSTASREQASIVAIALLGSVAFVDFSTSGLENPLSCLLLALFVGAALRPGPDRRPRLTVLWTLTSLLYLTRPDDVLLVLPALFVATLRHGRLRSAVRPVLLGLTPAAIWTLFALVYYGFPFPNTAYAKLATGIHRAELWQQGAFYLLDVVDRDPLTMVVTALGVGLGLRQGGLARGLALGVLLDLTYVASIGGDFMAGRFVMVPFFAAVLVVGRLIPLDRTPAVAVAAVVLVAGLSSARLPLTSDSRFERTSSKSTGIVDERAVYFRTHSLVLADRSSFAEPDWPRAARISHPVPVLETCGLMGATGLDWGPLTHLLDECALADPLLARLPAVFNPNWRSGHFRRMVPEGYAESLERRSNMLADPGLRQLYDDLLVVTRSTPLFSGARLRAIWRVNTGAGRHLIDWRFYRHAGSLVPLGDLATVVPDGTTWNAPVARVLRQPLAVVCEDRPGRRYLAISLDSNDRYDLIFVRRNGVVARMEVGPVPERRRGPGLFSYTVDLPWAASEEGFDTIVVAPAAGDDSYSIGHLLLDGYEQTEAELRRRVAQREAG